MVEAALIEAGWGMNIVSDFGRFLFSEKEWSLHALNNGKVLTDLFSGTTIPRDVGLWPLHLVTMPVWGALWEMVKNE